MASFRSSIALSLASRYSSFLVNLGMTMVMSRILTPREIGLYSIGAAAASFAHVFRDAGVSNYLIQERELTDARLRTTFGMSVVTSLLFGGILALASTAIADIYHEQLVGTVVLILSLNFLVMPLGSLAPSLLQRDMKFGALYIMNVASTVAFAAVGVSLAILGMGVVSMAWASFAGNVVTAGMSFVVRPEQLSLRPSLREWRRIMKFGLLTTGANVVGEFGLSAPDLIIGRLLGSSAVGLYSKALGFVTMFNNNVLYAISPVAVSKLASTYRCGGAIREQYLDLQSHLTVVAWPFLAFAIPMMPDVIRFLFGSQWSAAVPVAQILCMSGMITAIAATNWTVFIAIGAAGRQFRITAVTVPIKIVLVLAGAMLDLTAIATGMVAVSIVDFAISQFHLRRMIGVAFRDLAAATTRSILVTAAAVLVSLLLTHIAVATSWSPIETLLVGGLSGISIWTLAIVALNHPMKIEIRSLSRQSLNTLVRVLR